ncbi:MAG TPA: hypothetical protein VN922_21360 [Bacteroidia bacterium]|nr:hypothetical protein [Bacteroidia bacterium]
MKALKYLVLVMSLAGCVTAHYYSYDINGNSVKRYNRKDTILKYVKNTTHTMAGHGRHEDRYYELSQELKYPDDTLLFIRLVKNIVAKDSSGTRPLKIVRRYTNFNGDMSGVVTYAKGYWFVEFTAAIGTKRPDSYRAFFYPELCKKVIIITTQKFYTRD